MADGEETASGWRTARTAAVALVIGLVVGPVISNLFGWQVTRGTADAQLREAAVEQQAMVCEAQARAENQDPESLDWNARFALARKWAVMPGRSSARSAVERACVGKLAG